MATPPQTNTGFNFIPDQCSERRGSLNCPGLFMLQLDRYQNGQTMLLELLLLFRYYRVRLSSSHNHCIFRGLAGSFLLAATVYPSLLTYDKSLLLPDDQLLPSQC
ncbi:hypothetical protein AN958_08122 [Leucoagaricus sp. SymC.cos]|nr:hypothetical protein AN958_08122 [Leucoagaricus sp. SymC.cos]